MTPAEQGLAAAALAREVAARKESIQAAQQAIDDARNQIADLQADQHDGGE